ncbi:MAG TPA: hypothetical protein QF753_09705 [Victivallales bacterium]|nr:hypothetical protein [Victivallales bacterium]
MKGLGIFLVILILAVGIYYGINEYKVYKRNKNPLTRELVIRDKGISNLKIDITTDTYRPAFYVTAKWDSRLKNPKKSSVTMQCVATRTESGKGRKIIASESLVGLSNRRSGMGSLSCHISINDIPKKQPYMWVRIISVINGKRQKAIVKYLGKFR